MLYRLFTCLLIVLLAGGGLMHATIPHHHSHSHIVTNLIHTVASLEDTKSMRIDVSFLFLIPLMPLYVLVRSRVYERCAEVRSIHACSHQSLREALRRGVLSYRVFG